jgi:hypothetical protein
MQTQIFRTSTKRRNNTVVSTPHYFTQPIAQAATGIYSFIHTPFYNIIHTNFDTS